MLNELQVQSELTSFSFRLVISNQHILNVKLSLVIVVVVTCLKNKNYQNELYRSVQVYFLVWRKNTQEKHYSRSFLKKSLKSLVDCSLTPQLINILHMKIESN